jgi:hypothetical protein
MVKEAIMTIDPQTFIAAEKFPDKIKRRLPCSADVPNAQAALYCGERLPNDPFGDNVIIHRKFPFWPLILAQRRPPNVRVDAAARIPAPFAAPS